MPGGHKDAWPHIKPIFQSICAKADKEPCCDWVGNDGAGHFVKMVHNGIEYGDMQLIGEVYHLMLGLGIDQAEMADIFEEWNKGELESFLIEITRDILRYKDAEGEYILEVIKYINRSVVQVILRWFCFASFFFLNNFHLHFFHICWIKI